MSVEMPSPQIFSELLNNLGLLFFANIANKKHVIIVNISKKYIANWKKLDEI